jgi:hypothetical protein
MLPLPTDSIAVIPLNQGLITIEDDADAERLMKHSWQARNKAEGNFYASAMITLDRGVTKKVRHQRFLLNAPKEWRATIRYGGKSQYLGSLNFSNVYLEGH